MKLTYTFLTLSLALTTQALYAQDGKIKTFGTVAPLTYGNPVQTAPTVSTAENPKPVAIVVDTTVPTTKVATQTATEDDSDDIAGASTVVDDSTNNEGDISFGEVKEGLVPLDDDAIKSISNFSRAITKSIADDDLGTLTIKSTGKSGTIYTTKLTDYAKLVNNATWSNNMKANTAMTVKLQALLDWNHASPGPIDGGNGENTKKALRNFQKMHGIKLTDENIKKGTLMNEATWRALTKNIPANQPVLVSYTITEDDVNTKFAKLPSGAEARSKTKGLYYEDIVEMFGERFHMNVAYLKEINAGKKFRVGEKIAVFNTGETTKDPVTHLVANTKEKTLYAYNGDKMVAAYPTTIGSVATATPNGKFKIVNKVKMPWYKATVDKDSDKPKTYMLPPGPNSPVGVVWMGLSKPSYGIHGSPVPEGISRQASLGCIRLTNWDVLELFANVKDGATVEIK